MAPTRASILISRKAKSAYHANSKSPKAGSSIGGIIVATILMLFIIIFVCIFLYEYRKGFYPFLSPFLYSLLTTTASHLRTQSGTPINIAKVCKNAIITTLTLGLAGAAKRYKDSKVSATNIRGSTVEAPIHIGEGSDFRQPPPISRY
jgi:hypothetical protein